MHAPLATPTTEEAIRAYADYYAAKMQRSFYAFRQVNNPVFAWNWFTADVCRQLRQFHDELLAGARPIYMLQTPPQHGKSLSVIDFAAWVLGRRPDTRIVYASFSERLGVRANLRVQRSMDRPAFQLAFPEARINLPGQPGPLRNHNTIEVMQRDGLWRNTTVRGSVTGEGFDLQIVDDPIKGRAEANSKHERERVWEWLTDDFFTRQSDHAGLLFIGTRWHIDDPAGRLMERFGNRVKVLKYPAIAVTNEPLRFKGEPLHPKVKSLEFLNERKMTLTTASWEALYQQNPIIVGGGLFPIENFKIEPVAPVPVNIKQSVRYWDKAGTHDGGAYTCGVLMHQLKDGQLVISDVRRGQWSALERETRIKQTAQLDRADGYNVEVWVEQEPGSGGLESAERTILNLRGFNIKKDRVTGSKEGRCEPYAAQVQASNVRLVEAPWNRDFIDEHEVYPGRYKDQIDAAGGAFMKCTTARYGSYDSSLAWVGGPGVS